MILYHGTDSKNLEAILKNGLLPRKDTGNQVYGGDLASNPNFIYLTWWNPVAHAYSIDENSPVIIRVDVDETDLYPDEDFVERVQFMETGRPGDPSLINIADFKDMWRQSYNIFGNVAAKMIPPERILGHVVLDPQDFDYHCGLGAQGNQLVPDLRNQLNFIDPNVVKKYANRLETLFSKGWATVKQEILKERPSLTLSLPKPTEQIRIRGKKVRVLFRPNLRQGLAVYVCDEWQENFPIQFPMVDKRFSKLLQVPASSLPRLSRDW